MLLLLFGLHSEMLFPDLRNELKYHVITDCVTVTDYFLC